MSYKKAHPSHGDVAIIAPTTMSRQDIDCMLFKKQSYNDKHQTLVSFKATH